MVVIRVSSEEYEQELKKLNPLHAYNRPQFALLNNLWVDEIHFLLFKTSKVELAITLGERNNVLLSPWSAPFGGFAFRDVRASMELLTESITLLKEYALLCNCREITITFPPSIYAPSVLHKLFFVLENNSLISRKSDINYHLDLHKSESYPYNSNFKRNFKKGELLKQTLYKCEDVREKQIVYDLIENQRAVFNIPLKMGFSQIIATSQLIEIDFFLLRNESENFASAICYRVTPSIIQLIYWADEPISRGSGAMHQLSMQLRDYYCQNGFSIFDLGPASEKGVPNYGLCSFKETIGCDVSLKCSYTISIEAKE